MDNLHDMNLIEWIEISGMHGIMKTDESGITLSIPAETYLISKYPITNSQFTLFIEAQGYQTQGWWTDSGWRQREKDGWTQPRYWSDSTWKGAQQPVVGVSWFEAVAFCLWLSNMTGERITLPTEDQWQYAAQSNDGRVYPWGNEWDCERCNNSVTPCRSNATTSVRQYAHVGHSASGVVDMAGNVWEWCLTDYATRQHDITVGAVHRVIRGGSWGYDNPDRFRCDFRNGYAPQDWSNDIGFRVCRA